MICFWAICIQQAAGFEDQKLPESSVHGSMGSSVLGEGKEQSQNIHGQ